MGLRGPKTKWTDEQFLAAVRGALSIASTCRALGIVPLGGDYHTIKASLVRLGVDTSHWTGQGWRRARRFGFSRTRRLLEELLQANSNVSPRTLRERLFDEGLLPHVCAGCERTE